MYSANFFIKEFKDIDTDNDGFIDAENLLQLQNIHITPIFANCLVDSVTGRAADFNWFIRFRASWENLGKPWANAFLFEAMDFDGEGALTEKEVNIFIRDMIREAVKISKKPESTFTIYTQQFFDIMPGAQSATIRPALVADGKKIKKGLASRGK